LKLEEIIDKKVYVEDYLVGKVKDVYIDEEWKVTHLEVVLTKEAAKELLGAKTELRNSLAISALGKWPDCCTNDQIKLGVSKGQLNIYLRPPK
jgi:hypothetical protein